MTWSFADIPSLAGKVFIVTGGNTGLGRVTCLQLAKKQAHVIVASRSEAKTLPVIADIKKESGNDKVDFLQIDLLSLKSVEAGAKTFLARGLPLHGLVLNAGIMACPFALSTDGIESQYAVNVVAHQLLIKRLLSTLEKSAPSRIVILSSSLHKSAPLPEGVRFDKINDPAIYNEWTAYGQSKLGNILMAKELNRQLQERGVQNVYVNSVHPGVIQTELIRHQLAKTPSIFIKLYYAWGSLWGTTINEDQGASTQLYLATSPEVEQKPYRGEFFIPIAKLSEPVIPQGTDMALAKKMWEFNDALIEEKLKA
ncbi:hypothetical protein HDU97_008624 [Phlyctochytrium planicorne]|nr:hypothetical protein HDU97_008624 [Phlyctochytrium planicorne]